MLSRWGRGQETYGEDPILTKKLLVAFVTGLQNGAQTTNALGESIYQTLATCKHFVGCACSAHTHRHTHTPRAPRALRLARTHSHLPARSSSDSRIGMCVAWIWVWVWIWFWIDSVDEMPPRLSFDPNVTQTDLYQYFFPAWEACAQTAVSVMCAYNGIK